MKVNLEIRGYNVVISEEDNQIKFEIMKDEEPIDEYSFDLKDGEDDEDDEKEIQGQAQSQSDEDDEDDLDNFEDDEDDEEKDEFQKELEKATNEFFKNNKF